MSENESREIQPFIKDTGHGRSDQVWTKDIHAESEVKSDPKKESVTEVAAHPSLKQETPVRPSVPRPSDQVSQ